MLSDLETYLMVGMLLLIGVFFVAMIKDELPDLLKTCAGIVGVSLALLILSYVAGFVAVNVYRAVMAIGE